MNVLKHNDVIISNGSGDVSLLNDKRLKSFRVLETESNLILVEHILHKKKVLDRIPVHVGATILDWVKIQLI